MKTAICERDASQMSQYVTVKSWNQILYSKNRFFLIHQLFVSQTLFTSNMIYFHSYFQTPTLLLPKKQKLMILRPCTHPVVAKPGGLRRIDLSRAHKQTLLSAVFSKQGRVNMGHLAIRTKVSEPH